jgi:DNA-binding HxlR family transcriptional regulator
VEFWFDEPMLPSTYHGQDCSLARALEVLGERWTLLVLRDAFYGVRRFSDFLAHLDLPRSVLSARLRGLVEAGVLERRPDPAHAGRHLYELTTTGKALWPAVYALRAWGERYASGEAGPRREFVHDRCGHPLSPVARCDACDCVPEPEHVLVEPVGGPGGNARTDPVAVGLRRSHRLLDVLPERP